MKPSEQSLSLKRAMARAVAYTVAPLLVAYTLIAVVVVLSRSKDVSGWILISSAVAFLLVLPPFVVARLRFGRLLRQQDPMLAEHLGLGGRLDWNGARTLMRNEALVTFLKRRDYRKFESPALRRAASVYAAISLLALVFGSAMFGSFFVVLSIAYSLLP